MTINVILDIEAVAVLARLALAYADRVGFSPGASALLERIAVGAAA